MIAIEEIAHFLGIEDSIYGSIDTPRSIDDSEFGAMSLGWCSDKNADKLKELDAGCVIVSHSLLSQITFDTKQLVFLPVENPRRSFSEVLKQFFVTPKKYGTKAACAWVDPGVEYDGTTVEIGRNVVIESGSVLGKNVSIGHNTVIKQGTILGDGVTIGSNCTIGGVGFGYEQNEDGQYEVIPHIGNVRIGSNAEIGNNVAIDRAVLGSTIIGDNVKIDNLVHIAHGVEIGSNSLIIAHAMVAGSVKIGENVWVAPSSSIRQKLTIADNATVGMGSVVVKDVDASETVAGVPARPIPKK